MEFSDSHRGRQVGMPLGVGAFTAIATGAFFAVVPRLNSPYGPIVGVVAEVDAFLWWEWYAALLVALSVGLAVRRRTPARSAALVFGVGFGIGVNLGGIGINSEIPGIAFRLGWALVVGTALVTVLWLPSYLVGRGLTEIIER